MGDEMTLVFCSCSNGPSQVRMGAKIDWGCLEKQATSYRVAPDPER